MIESSYVKFCRCQAVTNPFHNYCHDWMPLLVFLCSCLASAEVAGETLDELIFSHAFGYSGSAAGAFNAPLTLAVGSQNRVVIADQLNHRIQICSLSGDCVALGAKGDAPGLFNLPGGVAVNSNGQIIVADTGNDRVQVCSMDGACEILADGQGQPRTFTDPLDVAVGSDGRIVVSEYRKGFQICRQGADCAVFDHPSLEWLAVDRDDRILSTTGESVFICDFEGDCEKSFGQQGQGLGEFSMAHDLTTDGRGRIFIADEGHARVQICSYSGDCKAFELHRVAPQLMYWPAALGLTDNGKLVVADREGDRIHIYDLIEIEGPAIPINLALNDAWYDPATPGQGFFLNVFDKSKQTMFVAWFTYDIERPAETVPSNLGDAGHRWLTAQGIYHTYTATLELNNTKGLLFLDNPDDPVTTTYGTMDVRFSDCGKGTIYYDIPSVNRSGEIPIYRLTTDSQIFCEQLLSQGLGSQDLESE